MVRQDVMLVIPSLSSGGAERVMVELAKKWASSHKLNIHFVILTDLEDFYSLPSEITVHRLGYPVSKTSKFSKALMIIRTMFRFRVLVRNIRPTFVLSFMTQTNIFSLFSLFGLNIRKIYSERNMPKKIGKHFYSFITKYSSGMILQTQELYSRLSQVGCDLKKLHVIPNPVAELNVDKYDLNRNYEILTIGRLVEQKGHRDLLHAFSIFVKLNPEYKLIILGKGPLKNELIKYAKKLAIYDQVTFCDPISNIESYYSRAKYFVLSSKREGFPNALLEAYCYGVPCISYDCLTGPADIISSSSEGLLVPIGDVESLAQAMHRFANEPDLLMGISQKSVESKKKYSIESISDKYLEVCLGR
ncbi:glycosyltransferase [Vibrio breoganii]|uniref:glycosyltransferase n=1 Tax=Vibrio breoganii TaxID=553239 RepID=UPI0021C3182E|nr:glycosyltransferase [Vibrio breoganii]MDN3715952.1 glycosyltransferase [Vibrio breoganii]